MHRLILAALLFLILGPVPGTRQVRVEMTPSDHAVAVPLRARADQSGSLRFVRGWVLQSPDQRFGGFSALAATGAQGLLLLSDNGRFARFEVSGDGPDAHVRAGDLPENGNEQRSKAHRDVEAAAHDAAAQKIWIALEGDHQVWRLDAGLRAIEARRALPAADWSINRGAEAMVRLGGDRFILFAEGGGDERGTPALLYKRDPTRASARPVRFFYDAEGKGQVSDAAMLPDGRILIVHRKLGWSPIFTTTIALADPAEIRSGATVRSTTIGTVPASLAENYEGAAVTSDAGRVYMWLVADNNFQRWQRSLLVQFELVGLDRTQQKGGAVTSPP